jgi:hypothetical protein
LASVLSDQQGVTFVVLNLNDTNGKLVSHNVYWISANNDYKVLNDLPKSDIKVRVLKSEKRMNETRWTVQFTNSNDRIAFFIHTLLIIGGEEILPSFWSDNYFSLAPKESVAVTVGCPPAIINGRVPVLKIEGWNVEESIISLVTGK